MKVTTYFKQGFFSGVVVGLALIIIGFVVVQKIANQAENIAQLDLHQLEYQDMDGNTLTLADFEGKNLLVNFWATWCAPCVKEFPVLDEAYLSMQEDFVFVMVSDESISKIQAFAQDKPYQFVYAKTGKFILNGIASVPQSFVFDINGNKKHHHPTIFEGEPKAISNSLYEWANN